MTHIWFGVPVADGQATTQIVQATLEWALPKKNGLYRKVGVSQYPLGDGGKLTDTYERIVLTDALNAISGRIEKALVAEDRLEALAALGMVARDMFLSLPQSVRQQIFDAWSREISLDAQIEPLDLG
jgi:hypothetical protein